MRNKDGRKCTKSIHSKFLSRSALVSSAAIMTDIRTTGQLRHRSILGRKKIFFVFSRAFRLILLPTKLLLIHLVHREGNTFRRDEAAGAL